MFLGTNQMIICKMIAPYLRRRAEWENKMVYYCVNFTEGRLNLADWVDCLKAFFSIMQCHSVQCVSKCARPVCSSAPQTACQASGCSAFIPGGAAFCSVTPNRWISRVGKTISENIPQGGRKWTHRQAKRNPPRKLRCCSFSSPGFVAVNAVRRSAFFPPPQKQPIGSRDQNGTNLDVQWEYCQVSKDKKGEYRLDLKAKERRTGITERQHIKEQGLPADPHCRCHIWRMPNSGSWGELFKA